MTFSVKIGGFYGFFWRFRAARHISGANCTKINWDRHGEAEYEIFSIERRFWQSKSQWSRFKETCAVRMRAPKSSTPVKVVILPLLASLSWKRLQIGMGVLSITTSTSDELFSCINIDDFERPWTSKIRGFYWFLRSSAAAHIQEWTAMKWLEIDWQFSNRKCYRLSRVSWALAQIFCLVSL